MKIRIGKSRNQRRMEKIVSKTEDALITAAVLTGINVVTKFGPRAVVKASRAICRAAENVANATISFEVLADENK